MRRIVLLLAPALVPALLCAQEGTATPARPISLLEAVRLAQRNAPAEVQARNSIRSASASVKSAYAAFIPAVSIGASAGYDPNGGPRVINDRTINGTRWTGSDALNLNVNLFDGGRRYFGIGTAKANVVAAEANEVNQRFLTALSVQQAFYNALAARESESAARSQLQQAMQQQSSSNSRVAAGVATRSDSLRALIQVQNAQLALLTARNNLETANASLTRLVATPFSVTAEPADTADTGPALPDSVELARLAAEGPTVAAATASEVAARSAARAARTPYLPTLDASFGRSGAGSDIAYGYQKDFTYQTALRFSLSYPLFNQLQREQQKVFADVAVSNAEATLRDTRAAQQQLLVQNLSTVRTGEAQVAIQRSTVIAAEEDLRVVQQRYNLGASTLLDVLTSQTQLTQARTALIQARFTLRVAKAQISALIGREF
ncbi:MAG: TolC family protein [Gemmatimonadota bacterium]|nr:TolC family protein [Gemmatimonadota bacterium]